MSSLQSLVSSQIVVKMSTTYAKAYSYPDALRAGFDYYRAIEVELAQNTVHIQKKPKFLQF
jgi:hypothetical protein